jgi:phosphoglycolate phosphatase
MAERAVPLVFDLDGTLVHTLPDIAAALARVFDAHGIPAPDLPAVRRMIGDGARMLIAKALAAAGGDDGEARIDALYREFLVDYEAHACVASAPFPQVPEALAAFRGAGHPLGVCTNKPHGSTLVLLRALGLDPFFDVIVGGDRLPFRKPDPRHLRAVLEALSPAGEASAIMIGDSRNDLLAARGAGIPCILVRHGYGEDRADDLGADLVVDGFAELPDAVRTLAAGLT